jgi:ADP-ribose pyrophosphatase YjhB (NUDIX family)
MIAYKKFDVPTPYPVVGCFAVDEAGQFPILHRSLTVRSARNQWALPTGLHDVGVPAAEILRRELVEELNLVMLPDVTPVDIGTYERLGDKTDPWHWVITMFAVRVETLDVLRNMEPDKHDEVKLLPRLAVLGGTLTGMIGQPELRAFIESRRFDIFQAIAEVCAR